MKLELQFRIPILGVDTQNLINQSRSQAGQDLFVVALLQGKKEKTFLEIGGYCPLIGNNTWLLEKVFDFSGVSIDNKERPEQWPRKIAFEKFYNNIKDSSWPIVDSIELLPTHIQQELIEVHNYNLYVLSYPYHIPHGKEGWEITRPKTKFILNDALLFDYSQLPNYFDYLQIDIHPPKNNWLVLEKIIKQKEFAVITFEHDIWDNTPESKQAKVNAYQLLAQLGYTLVADNVTIEPEHTTSTADGPIYFEDWYANPKYIDKSVIDCYKCIGTGWPKYYQQILFQPTVKV